MEPEPCESSRPAGDLILVVDDSLSARLIIQGVLEGGSFRVRCAEGGEQAIEAILEEPPALVVLDVFMPQPDGFATCARMRQLAEAREIPVLFLTGDERVELQGNAIAAGGDDLIHKANLRHELLIRVRSLLRISTLQRALKEEHRALEVALEQRQDLFRFIIHDLKGPLQVIMASLDLLKEENEQVGPSASNHLRRIEEMNVCMVRMIQDLLDVTRGEASGLVAQGQPLELAQTLPEWLTVMGLPLARKEQRLEVLLGDLPVVETDPALLQRLLQNLLENASKYCPRGSHIRLSARVEGEDLVIEVEDDGPGIPEASLEQIFQPFVRLANDRHTAHTSSGLGLAFCRLAARAMGGDIQARRREPRGSAFTLRVSAHLPPREFKSAQR